MLAIIPAGGRGSRIQPLAFSKELLPLGSCAINGDERPRAIAEYLLDRMAIAGATRFCFIIAPGKTDFIEYFGDFYRGIPIFYLVQPRPSGLCDAIFRARIHAFAAEGVMIGLPDTIWLPDHGLRDLPDDPLSLLLFPVDQPELFDAVSTDADHRVTHIAVKDRHATMEWIWGAMRLRADAFQSLADLWHARACQDEYLGTLINAWIAEGSEAFGYRLGTFYRDVGTINGWRGALQAINEDIAHASSVEALR